MTKIIAIAGIEENALSIAYYGNDPLDISEAQFIAIMEIDRLKDNLKQAIKINDLQAISRFSSEIAQYKGVLEATGAKTEGLEEFEAAQIGSIFKKIIKKIGKVVKPVVKVVTKIATAPARLAIKAILEILLPKAAPYFIYTLAPAKAKQSLNARGKRKLQKAESLKNFIVQKIGMKRQHVDEIIKRGIRKRYGKTIDQLFTSSVASPFFVPVALSNQVVAQTKRDSQNIIGAIIEILQKILSVFSSKFNQPITAGDLPSNEDFLKPRQEPKAQKAGVGLPLLLGAAGLGMYLLTSNK